MTSSPLSSLFLPPIAFLPSSSPPYFSILLPPALFCYFVPVFPPGWPLCPVVLGADLEGATTEPTTDTTHTTRLSYTSACSFSHSSFLPFLFIFVDSLFLSPSPGVSQNLVNFKRQCLKSKQDRLPPVAEYPLVVAGAATAPEVVEGAADLQRPTIWAILQHLMMRESLGK